MSRYFTTTASFFLILGLYFLYGWVAVPLVLPTPKNDLRPVASTGNEIIREVIVPFFPLFPEGAWERDPEARIEFLQFGQTIILFQKDVIEGPVAKLEPCTILFVPDVENPRLTEEERRDLYRQTIVLRTPLYAEIEFDGDLNFSRFPLPDIQGGKLIGPVTITSDMKEAGPRDDLYLETENVAFEETKTLTRINTVKDVRFRWGYNTGEGSMLNLELAVADPKNPKSSKEFSRLQFEKLRHLNLVFPEGASGEDAIFVAETESDDKTTGPPPVSAPGSGKTASTTPWTPLAPETASTLGDVPLLPALSPITPLTATTDNAASRRSVSIDDFRLAQIEGRGFQRVIVPMGSATLVDILCQREFCFFSDKRQQAWVASFLGNVEATRINPDGSRDVITGEELRVNFQPKRETAGDKPSDAAKLAAVDAKAENPLGDQLGNLEPVQFVVTGKPARDSQPAIPARLNSSQSGGVVLEGDQILYDLRKEFMAVETSLSSGASKEVLLVLQNRYWIRSEAGFQYSMNPDRAFGSLSSVGKGNLTGRIGDEANPKRVDLTWNRMQIDPDKLDPEQILIQLDGGVSVNLEDFGRMTAGRLKLWCSVEKETPANDPAGSETTGRDSRAKTPDGLPGGRQTFKPERAVVLDDVHFENESGTCDVKRLDIFFEQISPSGEVTRSRWTPRLLTSPMPVFETEQAKPDVKFAYAPPAAAVPSSGKHTIRPAQYATRAPSGPEAITPLKPIEPHPPVAGRYMPPTPTPNGPAATAMQPTTTVYSQNLLGFQSGHSRSFYAITGDQMKMIVLNTDDRSSVGQIWIGGNVRVVEKLADLPSGEAIDITGEEIQIWNPSSPDTAVQIVGKPPRNAVFKGKGVEMTAREVNIKRAINMIWSDGPGRLVAKAAARSATPPDRPNDPPRTPSVPLLSEGGNGPLLVEWNERMQFDGKTIHFIGFPDKNGNRVRALHENQMILCNVMSVHVNRFVSFFDDTSDVKVQAETIECARDVHYQNEQFDDRKQRKSFDRARVEGIRIRLDSGDFTALGPGILRSTFRKSDKGFAARQGKPQAGGAFAPTDDGSELAFLGVWFHDNIRGNFHRHRKEADIRGRVRTVYCPVFGWNDEIDIDHLGAATKRGYLLECESLHVAQMPDPTKPDQSSAEMTASGNASIDGNDFFGKAESIKYNQAKSLVIFEGNDFDGARIYTSKGELPAQRIEYNIDSGAVTTSHAKGFIYGN